MSFNTAFKWNGTHITKLGIIASADSLPLTPEPKTVTEEIPGRDGFFDFTEFNPAGRTHFNPRQWRFICSLEMIPGNALIQRMGEVAKMFSVRKGRLEVDACPGLWWDAIITNRLEIETVGIQMRQFFVYFQSQPFARSLDEGDETEYVWTGQPRV